MSADLEREAREVMCQLCGQRPQSAFEKEGLCERCRHVVISNLHRFRTPYPEPRRMPWPLTQALAIARRYLRFWTQEKTATLRHENNQIRKRNEKLTAAATLREKELLQLRQTADLSLDMIESRNTEIATLRARVEELEELYRLLDRACVQTRFVIHGGEAAATRHKELREKLGIVRPIPAPETK